MVATITLAGGVAILRSVVDGSVARFVRARIRDGAAAVAENEHVPRLLAGTAGIIAALLSSDVSDPAVSTQAKTSIAEPHVPAETDASAEQRRDLSAEPPTDSNTEPQTLSQTAPTEPPVETPIEPPSELPMESQAAFSDVPTNTVAVKPTDNTETPKAKASDEQHEVGRHLGSDGQRNTARLDADASGTVGTPSVKTTNASKTAKVAGVAVAPKASKAPKAERAAKQTIAGRATKSANAARGAVRKAALKRGGVATETAKQTPVRQQIGSKTVQKTAISKKQRTE